MSFREQYLAESARHLALDFNPAVTGHVAVDLQKGYCLPPLGEKDLTPFSKHYYTKIKETLASLIGLSDIFKSAGISNIWIRHAITFSPCYFETLLNPDRSEGANRRLKEFAQQAAELCVPEINGPVIEKKQFSAFALPCLDSHLKTEKINTLLVTGGYREWCVNETAVDARKLGYRVFVIDDLVLSEKIYETPKNLETFSEGCKKQGIYVVTSDRVKAIVQSSMPAMALSC